MFGSCKSISGKYFIFRKCYFSERKMFSCVWLYFKKIFGKYFLMFGCILENNIENTFFTCCSHFLTFSRLPNKHIMSFIPKNSNKTQKDSISRWDRDRNLADFDDRDRRRSARSWSTSIGAVPVTGEIAIVVHRCGWFRRSEGLTEQCVWERGGNQLKWK